MARFVLLYHDCPPSYPRSSHWDLMLESGDVLRTWALEQLPRDWSDPHSRTADKCLGCPAIAAGNAVVAISLGDHRRDYLSLEGQLTGNRGAVIRVAAGTYSSEIELPDCWRINLASDELAGALALTRTSADGSQWTLEWRPRN
jgi:hypothetical protein